MGGVIHANDLLHAAKSAEETYELGLLEVELFLVGEVLEGAASAFFCVRAGKHGGVLSFGGIALAMEFSICFESRGMRGDNGFKRISVNG